jgi:hypothetical protein
MAATTWIETIDGELVNLDRISSIKVELQYDKYRVVAYEGTGQGEKDNWTPYYLTEPRDTKADAQADLVVLKKLMGATSVEELKKSYEPGKMGFR